VAIGLAAGGIGMISVRAAAISLYRRLANLWPELLPYVVPLSVNRWRASVDYVVSGLGSGEVS
jgi:hypothetical protein